MYQSDNVVDKYYECDSHVGRSTNVLLLDYKLKYMVI